MKILNRQNLHSGEGSPSRYFATHPMNNGKGYFGGYRSPPIIAPGRRSKSTLGYFGGARTTLGDASINPFTGGDTGVSDPVGGGMNWASLLTGALQTGTAVANALHPTSPSATIAHPTVAPASGPSMALIVTGIAGLGLAAVLAFGGTKRRRR